MPWSVLHITMKPGAQAPEILHRKTHEFFYILEGSSTGRVAGRARTFRAGDYCVLPAGTAHRFKAGPRGVKLLDFFCPRLDLDDPDIVDAGG